MIRTLLRFGIFSLLIAGMIRVTPALSVTAFRYIHEKIWPVFFFFLLSGILFLVCDHLARLRGDKTYVSVMLAAFVLKFLASAIFAAWFILKPVPDRTWFLANFFILYLFFAAFEIYTIISNLRAQKNC